MNKLAAAAVTVLLIAGCAKPAPDEPAHEAPVPPARGLRGALVALPDRPGPRPAWGLKPFRRCAMAERNRFRAWRQ